MPVEKYRDVADMPRPSRLSGLALVTAIRRVWQRAFLLSPPDFPRGVAKFRSIEDAGRARQAHVRARMRRRRGEKPPQS